MTNSREIKKALTKAFKGVKFSVRTRNVCCETIKIEWTGYPFINQVREITKPWDTFVNNSDSMTDYFSYSGTEIEFDRNISADEAEMLSTGILRSCGYNKINGNQIIWNNESHYFEILGEGNWDDTREVNQILRNWKENGLSTSLEESPQAKESAYQARIQKEKNDRLEFQSKLLPLIKGDYAGTPANTNLDYIVIHNHEGVQAIEINAKFSSFKSANNAIKKIFEQHGMEWKNDGGYYKLDFSIHFTDGEIYANGRLDLSARDDNPFTTENIIGKHCIEFLEWQIKKGNDEAKAMLGKYSFEDIAPKSNIIQFPQRLNYPEAIEVDEPETVAKLYDIVSKYEITSNPNFIEVDEPEIIATAYEIIKSHVHFTNVAWQEQYDLPYKINKKFILEPVSFL